MFKEDLCLELVQESVFSEVKVNQSMIQGLMETLSFSVDMPLERVKNAVKEEIFDINSSAVEKLKNLSCSEDEAHWAEVAIDFLKVQRYRFPREELSHLFKFVPANSLVAQVILKSIERHKDLERRLIWLMNPMTLEDVQKLDPKQNCDEIYHFISYEFRSEMKIYSILYEVRAIIVANANAFLLTTNEFTERSVRRLVDTVLLFANALEWGLESYRGRVCIQQINEIHGRYHIPEESFKFILSGIMFYPETWNEKFGWRPLTEVEKLGWFHAMAKVGRAMNISQIGDYQEMKAWYEEYCRRNAQPAPIKRKLFDQIIGQSISAFPEKARPLILSAILAGMDDVFRITTGYPEPPEEVVQAIRSAFFTIGHLGGALPRIPWFRTLQSNSVYPYGYKVEELGVGRRSSYLPKSGEEGQLPEISAAEVAKHNTKEDLWVVIDSYVYDLSNFAKNHPGGQKILLELAGQDATEKFYSVKHSEATQKFMKNFRTGKLSFGEIDSNRGLTQNGQVESKCPFASIFS